MPLCKSKSYTDWNLNNKSFLKAFKCNNCSWFYE